MMMMMSGVTAVLTLSAISMDSRSDLPKVHYATALDWFIIISFLYCLASILEFAGVHYFTKVSLLLSLSATAPMFPWYQVGSGETFGNNGVLEEEEDDEEGFIDDLDVEQDWEDVEDWKSSSLPVSVITKWTGVAQCPPPPPLALPPRTSYLSARSLYGLNGSLSDSSESLPLQAKFFSLK